MVKINKSVDVPFPNGQMVHGGSSAIAVYNDDQKAVISKFKEIDNFERDAFYLFFVDNVKGKTGDVAGFMPLQRQVGFIYDNPNLFIVAHELAHGAFNLRHTFSSSGKIAEKNTTQNLMDYKGGSDLWKHQWELIRDPENMLFAWAQDESEGQYESELNNNSKEIIFIYNGIEFKKQQDSQYSDLYIDEDGENNNVSNEIKLKENEFIAKAKSIAWEGILGEKGTANIKIEDIPDNGKLVKVIIDNVSASLNIKRRKKYINISTYDKYFAPTIENLNINYDMVINDIKVKDAKLEVFKNGDQLSPIYVDKTITTNVNNSLNWDGRINQGADVGKYISVYDSPYTIKISGVFESSSDTLEYSDSEKFKVELESISLTPNNSFDLVKPNKNSVEIDKDIEAIVKVKNKQNIGVVTSLPLTLYWSFEDPDDISSKINVDNNGLSGDDNTLKVNGGKADINSVMWKSSLGYNSLINYNTAESDVLVSGQEMGKTKIQFSSSVISGDNYILIAKIKDKVGNILKEAKTGVLTVRKTVSFNNIYQMVGSMNMAQIMSVNNIDPAFSGDGCTDYTLNTANVTNLTAAQSPQFLAPLLPPIPLIDPLTGQPDPNTELPTAQELQDYASGNQAIKSAALIAIRDKAKKWFDRNNANLNKARIAYLSQSGITGPSIIGALYYHPKLDGDTSTGSTNYYPSGIQIDVANNPPNCAPNCNPPILVDPDDDWRSVQGFKDGANNSWMFLNISSAAREQIVARHEVGHASDHQSFGPGDHAISGLMHFSGDMGSSSRWGQ